MSVFFLVSQQQQQTQHMQSVVEIYNETPKDLLAGKHAANKMDIRVGDQGVYIPDLTSLPVTTADQVLSSNRI